MQQLSGGGRREVAREMMDERCTVVGVNGQAVHEGGDVARQDVVGG